MPEYLLLFLRLNFLMGGYDLDVIVFSARNLACPIKETENGVGSTFEWYCRIVYGRTSFVTTKVKSSPDLLTTTSTKAKNTKNGSLGFDFHPIWNTITRFKEVGIKDKESVSIYCYYIYIAEQKSMVPYGLLNLKGKPKGKLLGITKIRLLSLLELNKQHRWFPIIRTKSGRRVRHEEEEIVGELQVKLLYHGPSSSSSFSNSNPLTLVSKKTTNTPENTLVVGKEEVIEKKSPNIAMPKTEEDYQLARKQLLEMDKNTKKNKKNSLENSSTTKNISMNPTISTPDWNSLTVSPDDSCTTQYMITTARDLYQQSLDITNNSLSLLEHTHSVGTDIVVQLDRQGRQLGNVKDDLSLMDAELHDANRELRSIRSVFGTIVNWFTKSSGSQQRSMDKQPRENAKAAQKDHERFLCEEKKTVETHEEDRKQTSTIAKTLSTTGEVTEDPLQENIERIGIYVQGLKEVAKSMQNEISQQSVMIDRITASADRTYDEMDFQRRRISARK